MDDFLAKIVNKIGFVNEFNWGKGYRIKCIDAPSPYPRIDQHVWISKKEFLIIESINLANYINKETYNKNKYQYYQNFLTDDGKIKNEAYKLKIKFKKKNTLFALSLVLVMLLCSETENGDFSGAKIYINNKMLPIFSEFDINISNSTNYLKLGSECLFIDKDIDSVVNLICDQINDENEFYVTGSDVYSIFTKSIKIYTFARPDLENGFLYTMEEKRIKNLKV